MEPTSLYAEAPLSVTLPSAAPPPTGRGLPRPELPGYEILDELGRGGMGVVYQARQLRPNRVVALKMILAGALAAEEDLIRFLAEAEAVAKLEHPNLVRLYEVGQHQGQPFFTLEFVAHGSLSRKLAGTPLRPEAAVGLVLQLARAMQYAHNRGIVHRDLKPANILLAEDETPKVADFGLARRLELQSDLTASGVVVGTPSYMAPEQARGKSKEAGPAADIYALGAILYECLTGRPPFRAPTPVSTIMQVISSEPVPPSRLQPLLPRDVETICLKCLQKEPQRRYASAGALADDLARYLAGEPILARPVGWLRRTAKWSRRHPAKTVALLAVFLAMPLLLLWYRSDLLREHAHLQNLQKLQQEDAADQDAVVEHLAGDRLAEAERVRRRALMRISKEPGLADRDEAWRRLGSVVDFFHKADEAWFRAGEERYRQGQQSAEEGLAALGLFDPGGRLAADGWTRLEALVDAATLSRHGSLARTVRDQVHQEVYRQLLLLTYLRGVPWIELLKNPLSALLQAEDAARGIDSALDALARARELEAVAPQLKAADTVRLFSVILADVRGIFRGRLPTRNQEPQALAEAAQPSNAIDYFFGGPVHYFLARSRSDSGSRAQMQKSWRHVLDFRAPLATAEDRLREATRLDPKQFWPHFVLGRTLMMAKKYNEARQAFTACVIVRPDFPVGYQDRALATVHQALQELRGEAMIVGSWVLAGSTLPLAGHLPTWAGDPFQRLPESSRFVEDRMRGLQDSARALQLAQASGDPAVYWSRGEMFALLANIKEALEAFALGLEKEEQLARKVSRAGVLDKVQNYAQTILNGDPQNADAHVVLALVHFTRERNQDGMRELARALHIDPRHARANRLARAKR